MLVVVLFHPPFRSFTEISKSLKLEYDAVISVVHLYTKNNFKNRCFSEVGNPIVVHCEDPHCSPQCKFRNLGVSHLDEQ